MKLSVVQDFLRSAAPLEVRGRCDFLLLLGRLHVVSDVVEIDGRRLDVDKLGAFNTDLSVSLPSGLLLYRLDALLDLVKTACLFGLVHLGCNDLVQIVVFVDVGAVRLEKVLLAFLLVGLLRQSYRFECR